MKKECVFCRIVAGEIHAEVVDEDEHTMTFLDSDPLFPGHLLIVPRAHIETLPELPDTLLQPFFTQVRRAVRIIEAALGCEGSFVAQNNKISQSVPHLHFHVIPRKKGDGMRGFFWPRKGYHDDNHRLDITDRLKRAFQKHDVVA